MKKNKLKIALVIDDNLDKPDGVQQATLSLGQWLVKQGHEVFYLTSHSSKLKIKNVYSFAKIINLKFNGNKIGTPWFSSTKKIKEFLNQHHFDIVQVQTPYSPFFASKIINRLPSNSKIIASFHVLPRTILVHFGIILLKFLVFKSFKRIDYFVANTSNTARYYQKTWRINPPSVISIPVDLKNFPAKKRTYRVDDKINLVFLGRLVERKGCLDLLAAILLLPNDLKNKIVLHIGGQGILKKKIKKFVHYHNLQSIVKLHGFIDEKNKPTFLASGDLLIFPSRGGESFGISVLEGLANSFGIVLATDNPGYRTLLKDKPKLMFEPKNPTSLARCLMYWLKAPLKIKKDYLKWQKQHLLNFDLQKVVGPMTLDLYYKAYNSIITKK